MMFFFNEDSLRCVIDDVLSFFTLKYTLYPYFISISYTQLELSTFEEDDEYILLDI